MLGVDDINFISVDYNMHQNSIDITAFDSNIQLNVMAIDNPLVYARLYLNNKMQIFIDTEDSLDI